MCERENEMWYSGLFGNTPISSNMFYNLATQNLSLLRDFTDEKIPFIMLPDDKMPAPAAADLTARKIYLNELYFRGQAPQFVGLSVSEKLESLSWFVLHEAGHVKFTNANWIEILVGSDKNNFRQTVAQLVEDVFIEEAIISQNENFDELKMTNHRIIFNDKEIDSRLNKATKVKPNSPEELSDFLNYMICWKRDTVFDLSPFQQEVYDTLMEAKGLFDIKQRATIVEKIYKMLVDENLQEEIQQKKNSSANGGKPGSGESGEGQGGEGEGSEGSDIPDSEKFFDQLGKMIKLGRSTFNNGKVVEPFKTNYDVQDADVDENGSITTIKLRATGSLAIPIPTFRKLRTIEVGRGSVRSVKGQPKSEGKKITNIKHYNSGNIFGTQKLDGQRAGEGAPELIILVDGSGSMNDRTTLSAYRNKFQAAIAQAVAVARALDGSKIKLGIYIHTCGTSPDDAVSSFFGNKIRNGILIQVLKDLDEKVSITEIEKRAAGAIANFAGAGNADACAIAHVASLFKGNGDRIVVVVSDGLPAEYYKGIIKKYKLPVHEGSYYERVKATAMAVNALRKRGVKIFSISIDKDAIAPCNEIYGINNNVYADDVNKFEAMIINSTN